MLECIRLLRRQPDTTASGSAEPRDALTHRERIEEPFGWGKTICGLAQPVYRGLERVRSRFTLSMAANNLARLPRLPGA